MLFRAPKGVYMVAIEKVLQKFAQLDEYLVVLSTISETPENAFLKDKILIGSAKYYLQVSVACCLDVANHIIATENFRAPRDYADSFKVLEEEFDELCNIEGIIPAPYLARYKWVLVQDPDLFSDEEWHHFIKQSYGLIKSNLSKSVLKKLSGQ